MESKIHQPLGDVFHRHLLKLTQIQNALVRYAPIGALVQHWEMRVQPSGDIIGIQDCVLGGGLQSLCAHHCDVHPGDRQNACAAPWCRAHRTYCFGGIAVGHRMAWQEIYQMLRYANWSHARPAAAVGNAERFMQVNVAHIRAQFARLRDTDHRVEVRAIQIHLAAGRMYHFTNLANAFLEHPVRGRVGDHHGREIIRVLAGFGAEIVKINIAFLAHFTGTTCMPASTALAGFVPCALVGIRHTCRCPSPRLS